jgi:hypothetical protein
LTCGAGGAPFVSLPLKPVEPLPLLMDVPVLVGWKPESYSPCGAAQHYESGTSSETPSRARRNNHGLGR